MLDTIVFDIILLLLLSFPFKMYGKMKPCYLQEFSHNCSQAEFV